MPSIGKCVVISAIFALLVLIMLPLRPVLEAPDGLKIVATGERNALSKSAEVWISSSVADSMHAISAKRTDSGWERRGTSLVSYQNQPAMIEANVDIRPGDSLVFAKHAYSGIVEIRSGDFVRRYDLYSATPGALHIDLSDTLPLKASIGKSFIRGLLIYIAAFAAFFIATCFLARTGRRIQENASAVTDARPPLSLWLALPSLLIYSLALAVYWPAQMSPDSIDQWRQIVEGTYADAHPLLSTFLYKLAYLIYPAPQSAAFLQIVGFSMATWFFLRETMAWGVPKYVTAIASLVLPLFPANFMIVTTLWKDVPFTIGIIFLSALAAREVRLNLTLTWGSVLAMALAGFLTFGVRHNGIIIACLFFALLFVFARGRQAKFRVGVALASQVVVFIVTKTILLTMLGAYPIGAHYKSIFAVHVLGAMEKAGVKFDPADDVLMQKVLPREAWLEGYNCRSVVPLFWNKHISFSYLGSAASDLNALMFKEIFRHPIVFAQHQLCVTGLIWRMDGTGDEFISISPGEITDMPESRELGLKTQSLLPEFKQSLGTWISQILANSEVYTRPALYILLGLLSTVMLIYRRSAVAMLIFAPAAFNCVGLSVLMSAQDYRYLWPTVVMSLLVIVLAVGMAAAGIRPVATTKRDK